LKFGTKQRLMRVNTCVKFGWKIFFRSKVI